MLLFVLNLMSAFAINIGTNHVFYETGNYIGNYSDAEWRSGNMRPLVASYHLNPEKVRQQLQAIYNAGQREISLMLWYSFFNDGNLDRIFMNHLAQNEQGRMSSQTKENLRNIMLVLEEIGFKKVYLRFAQQWLSDPTEWSRWELWTKSADKIEKNWSYIREGILAVEDLNLRNLAIHYDLGAELGGLTKGKNSRYTKEIWEHYIREFSVEKSYGFSFAYWPGRIKEMYNVYDKVGVYPKSIALDIYGFQHNEIYEHLRQVSLELRYIGQSNLAIVIQETYYNDVETMRQIQQAIKDFKLNIVAIHQWPIERSKQAQGAKHITVALPKDIEAYSLEGAACKAIF